MQIKKWLGRSLIVIPLALGIAAVILAPQFKKPPEKIKAAEVATKVRIIKPVYELVSPKIIGYGSTMPSKSWDAVAEVSGRIVWMSDELKAGNIVPKGTPLLHIDDSEYKLALSQINAQINTAKVKADSIKRSISVEQKNQLSIRKEVNRQAQLRAKGVLSASAVEAAERDLLKADSSLQTLKSNLAIAEAEAQNFLIQRQQAELNLSRTKLVAPFDVRIVSVEGQDQRYANKGQALLLADSIDSTEIEAHFPIGLLRPLINSSEAKPDKHGALALNAVVRLKTSTHNIDWEAEVVRVSALVDRQTQTIGVIVAVKDPYGKAVPGERPPLVRNTFVEVELSGHPKGKQLVIPAAAIHEKKVYVLDESNRLDIRPVKVAFTQGRYAVINDGIQPDEKVIVSDLVPAIKSMLLEPVKDNKTRKQLLQDVTGVTPQAGKGEK